MMKQLLRLPALYIALATGTLAGCTKTDTIAPPEEAQNRILEYKIVNVQGDPIYGSVNDADSTVTIYLPFYKQLITLEPEITVSEGATITPASGTLIENLLEVFHSDEPIRYEVKDKAGKAKTYTLHIEVQQPAVTVDELSPDADHINEYTITMSVPGLTQFNATGTGFSENHELMKAVLVNEAGEESPALSIGATNTNDLYTFSFYIIKYSEPYDPVVYWLHDGAALYKLRVYNYSKVATTTLPIRIIKNQ